MPLCGVLWGAGVNEIDPWDRGGVEGGKFSVEGHADGGRICDSADMGGRARNGNLFVGIFKKDYGAQLRFNEFS